MPETVKNISVIIPAYNCGKYISFAVNSLLNQTFKNFEIIIVNDGSEDDTEKKVLSFNDERIKYYKTEHKGTSAALNFGIERCSYDWIARLDADDINTPNRLQVQADFINYNPDLDIVSSNAVYFNNSGKVLFLLEQPLTHLEIYEYLNIHNPINQSAMLCRKSVLEKNLYNESFSSYEDFELMFRIRDSVKFANINEYLVYTRLRKDSRTAMGEKDKIYNLLLNSAFKKMIDSKSKGDHFYWASVIAWLNYFYGDRKTSRSYFKNSFSAKNYTALLTTFLPEKIFFKFINFRLKYRLKSMLKNKSAYKTELKNLLKYNN